FTACYSSPPFLLATSLFFLSGLPRGCFPCFTTGFFSAFAFGFNTCLVAGECRCCRIAECVELGFQGEPVLGLRVERRLRGLRGCLRGSHLL
ncbi:hypothetical protein, partial [Streptomyces sp. GbtcB7]|uniref:hypothetical protein n=1 Tax=Streptomyces sp. GbtcB7 TaxID=2824752 RepID=UPI001C2F886B